MSLPLEVPVCPPAGPLSGGATALARPVGAPAGPARPATAPAVRWVVLCRPSDFQRVLGTAPCSRSLHFSVHHVPGCPVPAVKAVGKALSTELSTGDAPSCPLPVDDSPKAGAQGRWLGLVVPKRHAKRAVTRTLIKRQMRAVMQQHADQLRPGLWVLRLRAPFDKAQFVSAMSERLRRAVHDELAGAVQKALAARPALRNDAHG